MGLERGGRAGLPDTHFQTDEDQPHRAIDATWPLRSPETGTGSTLGSVDGVPAGGSEMEPQQAR